MINVRADPSDKYREAREEIRVTSTNTPGEFVVVQSPGLAVGFAAGDRLRVYSDGSFDVVVCSGNLAIRVMSAGSVDSAKSVLDRSVGEFGGRLDGCHKNLAVYTIPVSAGWAQIQSVFDAASKRHGVEWYYGNVYACIDGVTPLDWWK